MTDNSSIDLSLTNIWRAWAAFRRGKQPSREITLFESELERNLLMLCADLHTGRYQHAGYSHRIVNEKKRRDIAVASVRDRVVHRLLYDYLVPIVDPKFDHDVWSCRPGKGLHEALRRTQALATKYDHAHIWRADISKFFDNVDHLTLKKCLTRFVADRKAQELRDKVIDSYGIMHSQSVSQSGIPIGNLTSQIFANIYLNEFDCYVRHTIKPLGYLRYGDDFVVIAADQASLEWNRRCASEWLRTELYLHVHPHNDIVVKASQGLHFLGHHIYAGSPIAAEPSMIRKIKKNIAFENASSYRAVPIPRRQSKTLPWLLLKSLK